MTYEVTNRPQMTNRLTKLKRKQLNNYETKPTSNRVDSVVRCKQQFKTSQDIMEAFTIVTTRNKVHLSFFIFSYFSCLGLFLSIH
jgi:hypothetical protein